MGNTFLDLVIDKLAAIPELELQKCKVIFPNKRPAGYFRNLLDGKKEFKGAIPDIYSIEDFITSYSASYLADPIELIFILYSLQLKYKPEEDFDSFHSWGNMLLRDYDEMDKYLVDDKRFFSHLGASKELDETNVDPDMPLEFWSTINKTAPTELQEQFLTHWELFEKLYYDLKETLNSKNMAYAGMQYRETFEKFAQLNVSEPVQKYIFIGFNALSGAEEGIIRYLLKEGKALLYFDTDDYYLRDKGEEAGYFIRKAMKKLGLSDPGVFCNKLTTEAKNIRITGTALEASQVMALKLQLEQNKLPGSTAIILPDENMAIPLMQAFSENGLNINSSVGRSLNESELFSLFELIFDLQQNFDHSLQSFYYKDILSILSHPLIMDSKSEKFNLLIEEIEKKGLVYIHLSKIKTYLEGSGADHLFRHCKNIQELILLFEKIINQQTAEGKLQETEELLFRDLLNKLKGLVANVEISINTSTFRRFFKQLAAQLKMPTTDGNRDSIQIMGMLETRALSFDNVYILNVNENTLPAKRNYHSYIPFDVRKSFGLPAFDEQDALSTYYFYRLIQWAGNIHLFYSTNTGGNAGEQSRYIRQLNYFLKKKNPLVNVQTIPFKLGLSTSEIKDISFAKDGHYKKTLQERISSDGISPTFISTYYTCKLQFYLRYIAKIHAPVEISEELEADQFGTLFHSVMEEFYRDFKGKEILPVDIRNKKKELPEILEKVVKDLHFDAGYFRDKNSLLIESIEVLARNALDEDEAFAPFYMLGMEEKLECNISLPDKTQVKLQGKIDRIDSKDGLIRIIDYKTGNVQKFAFNIGEDIPGKDNKEAFQALFYSYLAYRSRGLEGSMGVILPLKKVNNGYQSINAGRGPMHKQDFVTFDSALGIIITEILDENEMITQTEDVKICAYCDFKNICIR